MYTDEMSLEIRTDRFERVGLVRRVGEDRVGDFGPAGEFLVQDVDLDISLVSVWFWWRERVDREWIEGIP